MDYWRNNVGKVIREFYMTWREDFDDQEGWFTEEGLIAEIERIKALDEDGEAEVRTIIKGENVFDKYVKDSK